MEATILLARGGDAPRDAQLVDLPMTEIGALLVGATTALGLLVVVGRWPWPERTHGPWISWSWAPVVAAVAAASAAALLLVGLTTPGLGAGGAASGASLAVWPLRRGERDDSVAQRPERRRRSGRKIGPVELVSRRRLRRVFEGGRVPGLAPEGARDLRARRVHTTIAVGRDGRGFPQGLSSQQAMRSGLLTGNPGSGKTTTAKWIVSRMLRGGFGAIWVEAKGDPEMREWLMAEAALRGVPFYEFAVSGESQCWDPLASAAGAVERRDLVAAATLAVTRGGPEYYNALFKEHALVCLRVLETAGRSPTLPALRRVWSPDALARQVGQARIEEQLSYEVAAYLEDLLEDRNARKRADVESTATRLADVVDACGDRLARGEEPGELLDLRRVVERGGICIISLDAATYPAVTKALGQLVVADAMAACAPWIERRELAKAVLVLDEFPRYAGPQVGELMALTARAAGMPVILATQEIKDLEIVAPGFTSRVVGTASWLGVGTTVDPESADYLARAGGQTERIEATHQTSRNVLGFDRQTGLGTEAHGRQWILHPNDLQELAAGWLGLVTKSPHQARIVRVYRPESGAELLERFNGARTARARPRIDFEGLRGLHAAARRRTAEAR